jgi:hypothetical protein
MADLPGLVPPPPKSKLKGRLWQVLGGLSMLTGFLLAGAMELGLPLALFGALGALCIMRGKRHMALAAGELLARDPRPPVVYLRSFQADATAAKSADGVRLLGGFNRIFDTTTIEERLVAALSAIGPVIAIGKPGETLPMLGAARMYVDDEHWQRTVHLLMERAALVVLRLGDTPGFWWELEHSLSLEPTKLVLIVPFKKAADYEAFRKRTETHFPHPLPPYGSPAGLFNWRFRPRRGLGKLFGLIYFQRDWTPKYVDLTRIGYPWRLIPRYVGRQRLMRSLNWNLQPILKQLAIGWKPPRVRWVVATAMALFVILLGSTIAAGFSDGLRRGRANTRRQAAITQFVSAAGGTSLDDARDVAEQGWLRLSDARLIDRAGAIGKMLQKSGESGCAGLIRPGENRLEEFLKYDAPEDSERWYGILADSAVAERTQRERQHVTQEELRETYRLFLDEQDRFVAGPGYPMPRSISSTVIALRQQATGDAKAVFETFEPGEPMFIFIGGVPDSEVCSLLVNLHYAATVMPPPHNGRLARALTAIAAR